MDNIRLFAESKLDWIRKHQLKIRSVRWITPPQYVDGENHPFLGKSYKLRIIEQDKPVKIIHNENTIDLYIRQKTSRQKRAAILDEWYRFRLKEIMPNLIRQYEQKMNVHVEEWGVKKMKTKWGTCNITAKRIWFNLELAKKPLHCVEHVVVHELVHLLERKHNGRFIKLMDQYLPQWRALKDELNRFPVSHAEWEY